MKIILAPIDFSEATIPVLEAAASLARAVGAMIVLVHAIRPVVVTPGYSPDIVSLKIPPEVESGAQLTFWQNKLQTDGLTVSTSQPQGEPATCIRNESKRLNADFIVVGSHGHGALYELLMGSTAAALLRDTPCPLLVVPIRDSRKSV